MDNIKILFPVDRAKDVNPEIAVSAMEEGMLELLDNGALRGNLDDIVIDYNFEPNTGYVIAEIDGASVVDASKFGEIGSGLVYRYPKTYSYKEESEESKQFSMASIQDRLKISKYDPKLRLRYLVLDYKRYWNSKKSTLEKDPKQVESLKNMFLADMTGLFSEILPYIEEGKQLNNLIGVSSVTPQLTAAARDLSLAYRRALTSNSKTGQIPKTQFNKLKVSYNAFMTGLLSQVFPGIESMLPDKIDQSKETKTESRHYSYSSDGRIKLFD